MSEDDVEALLAQRQAANPRRTPDREPLGTPMTRRLVGLTLAAIVLATLVLVVALALTDASG